MASSWPMYKPTPCPTDGADNRRQPDEAAISCEAERPADNQTDRQPDVEEPRGEDCTKPTDPGLVVGAVALHRVGALTQELRERWRKAEARVDLFTPNTMLWRQAREDADDARRAYERRLRSLSKKPLPDHQDE
jgi:hypothetical protein